MTVKFDRSVVVQVGTAGSPGQEWSDLRVDFDVKHTSSREPNTATLKVYNWAEETIGKLRQDDAVIRLLAGYGGPSLIFAGEPRESGVKVKYNGPDIVTEIVADDGGGPYRKTQLNISIGTSVRVRRLFRICANRMGLALDQIQIDDNRQLSQGVSLQGPARDVLDRVADMAGAEWSIQDRQLRVIQKGGDTGRQAAKFSRSNGTLMGRPEKTDDGLSLVTLLEPGLRPKDRFVVEDEKNGGIWRAETVQFRGSIWSDKFHSHIKAKQP